MPGDRRRFAPPPALNSLQALLPSTCPWGDFGIAREPLATGIAPAAAGQLPSLSGCRLTIAPNSQPRVPRCGHGRRSLGRTGIREGGHPQTAWVASCILCLIAGPLVRPGLVAAPSRCVAETSSAVLWMHCVLLAAAPRLPPVCYHVRALRPTRRSFPASGECER